jgi:hypothetical protein
MVRSPTEIQADIALTRQVIESQLDALERKLPRRWWTTYAWLGAGLVLGAALSRIPVLRIVSIASGLVTTGVSVAGAVAAAERFASERKDRRAA